MKEGNVIPLKSTPVSVQHLKNSTMEPKNKGETMAMAQDIYGKADIDLKFENLETKVNSKFEQLSQKIDFCFNTFCLKQKSFT